jgi:predicted RNA polymerase sigma factor
MSVFQSPDRALQRIHGTPVVRLNRAVAVAMAEGPEAGLRLIDDVAVELEGFYPLHAARADLLLRAGRRAEAAAAYTRAIAVRQRGRAPLPSPSPVRNHLSSVIATCRNAP